MILYYGVKSPCLWIYSSWLKIYSPRDVDIPLTEKGIMEALAAGKAVSEIDFDIIFTSRLVRSKQTALIAMTQVSFIDDLCLYENKYSCILRK